MSDHSLVSISVSHCILPTNQLLVHVAVAIFLLQWLCCGLSMVFLSTYFMTSASLESFICPSLEPRLCITLPWGKGMKASPCHCVVSSRLMETVARDLHNVGGLTVCSLRVGFVNLCACLCVGIYSNWMCWCFYMRRKDSNFVISTHPWSSLFALRTEFVCSSSLLPSHWTWVWHSSICVSVYF